MLNWPYPAFVRSLLAEVARQVAKVLGPGSIDGALGFFRDRRQIAPAVSGQDHAVDSIGNFEMPGDPSGRHERGHRDRQHGDLGRETGSRSQLVEHPPQCEFGQAAGHKEIARDDCALSRDSRLAPSSARTRR